MNHWTTRILGNSDVFAQAVTVNGELAGNLVAWWDADQRFLGFWFGRQYWGRGIGTGALALFLQRETTRPLRADPFLGNSASVRLLEKHGFRGDKTVWYGEDEHIMLVLDADR